MMTRQEAEITKVLMAQVESDPKMVPYLGSMAVARYLISIFVPIIARRERDAVAEERRRKKDVD